MMTKNLMQTKKQTNQNPQLLGMKELDVWIVTQSPSQRIYTAFINSTNSHVYVLSMSGPLYQKQREKIRKHLKVQQEFKGKRQPA